jgi:hypothetical protein
MTRERRERVWPDGEVLSTGRAVETLRCDRVQFRVLNVH